MLDSIINVVIPAAEDSHEWQCILGILTTVTNHYIAWISIFLRAYRITKFFNIYDKYLERTYRGSNATSQTLRFSVQEEEDQDIIKEFR